MQKIYGAALVAALGLLGSTIGAQALDRRVEIVNSSSYDIVQFYASNKGTNDWQEDILGDETLKSGTSIIVNIDDGSGYCKFDFLAVFEDGDKATSRDNNVCALNKFTFTD